MSIKCENIVAVGPGAYMKDTNRKELLDTELGKYIFFCIFAL